MTGVWRRGYRLIDGKIHEVEEAIIQRFHGGLLPSPVVDEIMAGEQMWFREAKKAHAEAAELRARLSGGTPTNG